jgi:hypothetical protein
MPVRAVECDFAVAFDLMLAVVVRRLPITGDFERSIMLLTADDRMELYLDDIFKR